jgi:hypothetical protein
MDLVGLGDLRRFEVHESIVRVSANQTANFGKKVEIVFRTGFVSSGAFSLPACESAKFMLDIDRKSTTIWLWIDWVQHLRLCLIQPGGR